MEEPAQRVYVIRIFYHKIRAEDKMAGNREKLEGGRNVGLGEGGGRGVRWGTVRIK